MKNLILSIAVVILFEDCSDNSNMLWQTLEAGEHQKDLKITTCVFSFKSSAFKETFTEGSSMGIYILPDPSASPGGTDCRYKNIHAEAIRQTDNSLRWECAPAIGLCRHPIRVYAYYPYCPTASRDTASVPVRISADARYTPDFRYGTLTRGHKPINEQSPVAMLSLSHGLPQLAFRLYAENDSTVPFQLESIQVGNCAGSSRFCQRGEVNIVDGTISGISAAPGATRLAIKPAEKLTSKPSSPLKIKILPLSGPLNEKEIEVIFRINRQTYAYRFPAGTTWKSGYEYLYTFSFDGQRVCMKQRLQLFN